MSNKIMKSKPFGALFGLLALVAILGVAPAFGQTTNEIHIAKGSGSMNATCITAQNCFNPNPLTVIQGTTVTWVNDDSGKHSVLSGKLSDDDAGKLFITGDKPIKLGETFRFTFTNVGTYDYFDPINPWMSGQVIVAAAASTTPTPTTPAPAGNATVPEFGPVAGIVLAIAVLSVVVFAAKTRVIPRL